MKLSKKDCCCGKDMGKGWGNTCEFCPSQGMGEYTRSIRFFENVKTSTTNRFRLKQSSTNVDDSERLLVIFRYKKGRGRSPFFAFRMCRERGV